MSLRALLLLASVLALAAADSVTDELEKNGLPVGLLPASVQSYAITKDGHFTLSLSAPCYARIDDQVRRPSPIADSVACFLLHTCIGGCSAPLLESRGLERV
jgi:hypothetical protein